MLISIPVGLVKFFGNLAIMDSPQQVCETYPAFQNKVFEMALNPDPAMTGVALDTLGLLGSTVEGKQVLQKTGQSAIQRRKCSLECLHVPLMWILLIQFPAPSGEKFKKVFSRMSQLASTGATELRVRSLDAIAQILTLQVRRYSRRQIHKKKLLSVF